MSGYFIEQLHVSQTVSISEGKSVTTEAHLYLSEDQANIEANEVAIIVGGIAYAIGETLKKHIEPEQ